MIYKMKGDQVQIDINPITNEPYTGDWIIYCLTDSKGYEMLNGIIGGNVYILRVSRYYLYWEYSLMDFIGYQESRNKNILLYVDDKDLQAAQITYTGHKYNDNFLRSYESDFFVHSTTMELFQSIKQDDCLKSWNVLKREKEIWEESPIGIKLGDPRDFSDYIMFSNGGISSEIVVLSKQKREITMDINMKYKPGVRLYFDGEKIAKAGLLLRDGCHLKVKHVLALSPFLNWIGDWKSVGLKENCSTPAEFTELANNVYRTLREQSK